MWSAKPFMSKREWRFCIDDMIDFAEHVIAYTQGLDQAGLVADRLHYDATIRNLELIGGNRSVPLLKSPLPQRERVGERDQKGRGD
jgi:hypothetical protein